MTSRVLSRFWVQSSSADGWLCLVRGQCFQRWMIISVCSVSAVVTPWGTQEILDAAPLTLLITEMKRCVTHKEQLSKIYCTLLLINMHWRLTVQNTLHTSPNLILAIKQWMNRTRKLGVRKLNWHVPCHLIMDCETELQTMSIWVSTKPLLLAPVFSASWFTWPSIGYWCSRNSEMQEVKDIRVLPLPFAHPQCLLKFCVLKFEVYGMPQVGSGRNQLFALQHMKNNSQKSLSDLKAVTAVPTLVSCWWGSLLITPPG